MPRQASKFSPDSPSAIQAIDDLLASVGLEHGRRKLGRAGIRRQARYNRQPEVEIPPQPQPPVVKSKLSVVQVSDWSRYAWLQHGFSTRTGGVTKVYRPTQLAGELNLGLTASDTRENVLENRRRFIEAVAGNPDATLVTLKQIHSNLTRKITTRAEADVLRRADGLMTDRPGILLGIQTADCIPVMIADTRRKAVAIFHAGWRGTLKRIVEGGVGRMRMEFRSRPEDLIATIGPGIAQCCYSVGEEVCAEFTSQFAYAPELFCEVYDSDPIREKYPLLFLTQRAPGHSPIGPSLHLDLFEANRRQLLDAGLRPQSIHVIGHCTSCQTNRYFSHRAGHGFAGRMLSVIGIRAS
ncbi:MAG: peptidoglycan editing factor PgeF [Acidobacteriaceae bacterium]